MLRTGIVLKKREGVLRHLPFAFFLLFVSASAVAEPVIEEEVRLDFGLLAIPDNSTPAKFLRVPVTGAVESDPGIIQINPPVRGQLRLTGFPPNTRITVTSSSANLTAGGQGQPPVLEFTDIVSNEPLTDDQGAVDLVIAGTLGTSATGQGYPDAPYEGSAIIDVSYWSPTFEQVISQSDSIDVRAGVSTALDLSEVNALSFGRVAATAGTDGQASLVLDPDGDYRAVNTSDARIVPLSGASPATVLVEGAAAFYDLVIQGPASSVYLSHENLGSAPRFEVTDFVTLPSGTGRTNRDGQLEIQVGATLKTEQVVSARTYPEGTYSGTYELTVEY
jgi:hypothetical protein